MGDKAFGARLRAAREAAAMRPAAVCAAVEIPNIQTLSAYERGTKFPSEEVLARMATLYHVSVKELMGDMTDEQAAVNQKAEYIRQLVEAATALNLGFITREDPYQQVRSYALNLSDIEVDQFYLFLEKWAVLCQLHNDGIISKEEYTRVVLDRLNELQID